ncbi:MAG: heme o synthase [Rhodocyclaceae bacterium]
MRTLLLEWRGTALRFQRYLLLTKPRVISLIVFCAVIGMFLAVPDGRPDPSVVIAATLGIALVAGSAAAVNCIVESHLDALMARTRARPLARGELAVRDALIFSGVLGGIGLMILYRYVNPLTMGLTLATFLGYAIVYTVFLKPRTPQNIVIGGASGAMPPVLGWAAATGELSMDAWVLFMIIFTWTPPHFWSLALYRTEDYARAGFPMLPVTHGSAYTRLTILVYTCILFAVALLPFATGMSGRYYLACALVLNSGFLAHAIGLYFRYSDRLARRSFRFSILYLAALFAALLLDHYL